MDCRGGGQAADNRMKDAQDSAGLSLHKILPGLADPSDRPRIPPPGGEPLSRKARAVLIRNAIMNAHLEIGARCRDHLRSTGDPMADYIPLLEILRPDTLEFAGLAMEVVAIPGIGRKMLEFLGAFAAQDEFNRSVARGRLERIPEDAAVPPEASVVLSAFCFPSLTTVQALDELPGFEPAAAAALFMGRFDAGETFRSEEVNFLSRCGGDLLAYAQSHPADMGRHQGFIPSYAVATADLGPRLKEFFAAL